MRLGGLVVGNVGWVNLPVWWCCVDMSWDLGQVHRETSGLRQVVSIGACFFLPRSLTKLTSSCWCSSIRLFSIESSVKQRASLSTSPGCAVVCVPGIRTRIQWRVLLAPSCSNKSTRWDKSSVLQMAVSKMRIILSKFADKADFVH